MAVCKSSGVTSLLKSPPIGLRACLDGAGRTSLQRRKFMEVLTTEIQERAQSELKKSSPLELKKSSPLELRPHSLKRTRSGPCDSTTAVRRGPGLALTVLSKGTIQSQPRRGSSVLWL